MGALFSKKKPPPPSRTDQNDRAVLDLKNNRDRLKIHAKKLEKMILKDVEAAKKFLSEQRKDRALLALRSKKHHEKLVQDSEEALMKVEEMLGNVELLKVQKEVVEALSQGTSALKNMQKEFSLSYVEKLMEEAEEAREIQKEIGEMLSREGVEEDEEVLGWLDQINEELALDESAALPSVPTHPLPEKEERGKEKEKEEEEEEEGLKEEEVRVEILA